MGYKKNYNSLLPDDFVLSEEFESIVEQLENTKIIFILQEKLEVVSPLCLLISGQSLKKIQPFWRLPE